MTKTPPQSKPLCKIGKYVLFGKLGTGGFGSVRRAVNSETGETVAVKIMDKEELRSSDMTGYVKNEIELSATLKHPNIVQGREVFMSKTKIFMVMEFVGGGDLHDFLAKHKRLTEEQAQKYFCSIVSGLQYCHARGVYHRDLKLENLLLTSAGVLKLCDFGLANIKSDEGKVRDLCRTNVGTEDFSSPEVLRNIPYRGDEADMWSAGILLYTMLAGYCPFQGKTPRDLYQNIIQCKFTFPKGFPEEAKMIVALLLVPEGKDRPSAKEVLKIPWVVLGISESNLGASNSNSSCGDAAIRNFKDESIKGIHSPMLEQNIRKHESPRPSLYQHVSDTRGKDGAALKKEEEATGYESSKNTSSVSKLTKSSDRSTSAEKNSTEKNQGMLLKSGKAVVVHETAATVAKSFSPESPSLSDISGGQASGIEQQKAYSVIARTNIPKFLELYMSMRNPERGFSVGTQRWRLRTYPNCFIGSEAVSSLAKFMNSSRQEAIYIGQLFVEMGVFHHVCRFHDFEDNYLFYRWQDDEPDTAAVLNLRKTWDVGSTPSHAISTSRKLLLFMLKLYERHRLNGGDLVVDVRSVQRDSEYKTFLIAVGELQIVDITSLSTDEQKLAFLINVHNLLWLQARVHMGDSRVVSRRTVEARAKAFQYIVDGAKISLAELERILSDARRREEMASLGQTSCTEERSTSFGVGEIFQAATSSISSRYTLRSLLRLGRKHGLGANISETLTPNHIDPLVHFLLNDTSPQAPAIYPIDSEHVSRNQLEQSSKTYLISVLGLDVAAGSISYPSTVSRFSDHLKSVDGPGLLESIRKICRGHPLEQQVLEIEWLSVSQKKPMILNLKDPDEGLENYRDSKRAFRVLFPPLKINLGSGKGSRR